MTQRHQYIVQIAERVTGEEYERVVDAASAEEAQAIAGADTVFVVGAARRADGTPEPPAHTDTADPPRDGFDLSSMPDRSGPYDPADSATDGDILAVNKLISDRLAWIQRFLVWSFYGVPLFIIGVFAGLTFIGSLGRADPSSPVFILSAIISVICFASLATLLQSIYPTFAPAKKPFRPIEPSDEDLDELRARIEARRAERRARRRRR